MEAILIKSTDRNSEHRDWMTVYNCFDSGLFSSSENKQGDNSFSLKEVSIQPNMGFIPHRHKNKDFIILPVQGRLIQKNHLGESYLASKGDIHIMSSGSGITHFEYNQSKTENLNCIVFEILPEVFDDEPKCMTVTYDVVNNQAVNLIPVDKNTGKQALLKNVTAYYGHYEKEKILNFKPSSPSSRVLVYVIEGCISIGKLKLEQKDTIGFYKKTSIKIKALVKSQFLLFEVFLQNY